MRGGTPDKICYKELSRARPGSGWWESTMGVRPWRRPVFRQVRAACPDSSPRSSRDRERARVFRRPQASAARPRARARTSRPSAPQSCARRRLSRPSGRGTRDLSAEVGCGTLKWMLPSPRWPNQETREPGSTASPAHAKRCEPDASRHGSPAPRQARAETATKQRHEQPRVDRACGTS